MFIAYSETDTTMALQIGDEFHLIEAAEAAIVAFEKEQCISFWKRDTRTIVACRKRDLIGYLFIFSPASFSVYSALFSDVFSIIYL